MSWDRIALESCPPPAAAVYCEDTVDILYEEVENEVDMRKI